MGIEPIQDASAAPRKQFWRPRSYRSATSGNVRARWGAKSPRPLTFADGYRRRQNGCHVGCQKRRPRSSDSPCRAPAWKRPRGRVVPRGRTKC